MIFLVIAIGAAYESLINDEFVQSKIDQIDVLHRRKLAIKIDETIHFRNVILWNNTLHLYNVTTEVRNALQSVKSLPPYKIFYKKGSWNWLSSPYIKIHNESLDVSSLCPNGLKNEVSFVFAPWVMFNLFHLHNDNILPIVDSIRHTSVCDPITLKCKAPSVLYQYGKSQIPPLKAAEIMNLLFDHRRSWDSLPNKTCFSNLVWGRGPCLFYQHHMLKRAQAAVNALKMRVLKDLHINLIPP